jgi:hypothetical protein
VLKLVTALAATCACALAAPAGAGAFTLGPGAMPGLAVDAAGTAYIAWSGPGSPASLQFCRLPRGATACDIRHAIVAPGDTTSRAFVAVNGTRVIVVQYRYGASSKEYAFTSTNGGASFGAGRSVGTLPFFDAVVGPGDTMSGVTSAQPVGGAFQNVPLDGASPEITGYAQLSGPADHPYQGTVALLGGLPLAVFTTGGDAAEYRRYDGSGSLNDDANWTLPVNLGVASHPRLASGPSGLFLLATTAGETLYARKWTGASLGPPVAVASGAEPPTLAAFEDAGGRLHAVFERGDASGRHLIHAVSDDGVTWHSGTAATQVAGDGGFGDPRVATGPDHVGVAVWADGPPGPQEIRVTAVGPGAPIGAPPTPAPTPAPTPVAKRKPSFGGTGSAKRVGRKVRVRISGELVLPAGVGEAAGCNGTVNVSIARRGHLLASRTVNIRPTCRFGLKTRIKRSKVKRARKLSVILRFGGNDVLEPARLKRLVKVRSAD